MRSRLRTIAVIAGREFVTRGRSKAFRISSALLLVGLVIGIVLPTSLNRSTNHFTVALVQASTNVRNAISAQAAAAGITVTSRSAANRAAAVQRVETGRATAAVVGTQELIWKKAENARLAQVLTAALTQVDIGRRAHDLGIAPAQLDQLFAPTKPTLTLLHPQPNRGPQTIITLIGIILLFVALNFYGAYVLTGVVEEKSSRIVEVLLARTRPADLLVGKVSGIGLLGLSQFAGMGIVAAITLQITQPPNLPADATALITSVVVWFVLGYAFFSLLYGALGALASRSQDAQAATAPLTVFMMLIYFGAFASISSPRSWWVTAASLFPPTAPIFMPMRTALADVPAWQIAAAAILMVLAILALIRAGGRIYRGAVLHTGGRLGIRQAWHRG
jgi:ABC-2 type transport system permease protein